jgi:hypothetical protein
MKLVGDPIRFVVGDHVRVNRDVCDFYTICEQGTIEKIDIIHIQVSFSTGIKWQLCSFTEGELERIA